MLFESSISFVKNVACLHAAIKYWFVYSSQQTSADSKFQGRGLSQARGGAARILRGGLQDVKKLTSFLCFYCSKRSLNVLLLFVCDDFMSKMAFLAIFDAKIKIFESK